MNLIVVILYIKKILNMLFINVKFTDISVDSNNLCINKLLTLNKQFYIIRNFLLIKMIEQAI